MHQVVHRVGFEHLLLFLNTKTQNRAEEVCELDRVVRAEHDQANLGRHLRQVSEGLLDQCLNVAFGCFDFFRIFDFQFGKNLHARAQEWLFLHPLLHANSICPLDDQVQRVVGALHPFDHH